MIIIVHMICVRYSIDNPLTNPSYYPSFHLVDVAGGLTIAGIESSTEEAAPTCDERVKKGVPVSDEFKTCCAYDKPEGSSLTKRDFCKSLGCRVAKCP